MSLNGNTTDGEPLPHYLMNSSSTHNNAVPGERRRRGGKNMNGYYPGGGNRMNSSYRHRGAGGGSGDGPSNYRGGSDYDSQQQHHHSHHHHHQGKNMDYDSMGGSSSRQQRGGGGGGGSGMHQHQHQTDYRTAVPQQTDIPPHHHNGFGGGVGVNSHIHQIPNGGNVNVVLVPPAQQQADPHPYPTGADGPHFLVPGPGPAPPVAGFFGYHQPAPTQPMLSTLALCHIPYGMNPSSVISPLVYTQIIGSGILNPALPNFACAMPSPVMPTSHQMVFQQGTSPQQMHYQQHTTHQHINLIGPGAVGGMQNMSHTSNPEDFKGFDSSSLLNPDADAFFPPTFSPDNGVEEGGGGGSGGGVPTVSINGQRTLEMDTSEIKSDEQDTPRLDDTAEDDCEANDAGTAVCNACAHTQT